jgi:hypothetical protein
VKKANGAQWLKPRIKKSAPLNLLQVLAYTKKTRPSARGRVFCLLRV